MLDDASLDQVMRQHRHCQPGGAADLHGMRVSWTNPKMLGEHGRQHDVRRDGGIAAEHAVDLRSRQPGVGNRKLGGLAHEVEGGRALMPPNAVSPTPVMKLISKWPPVTSSFRGGAKGRAR